MRTWLITINRQFHSAKLKYELRIGFTAKVLLIFPYFYYFSTIIANYISFIDYYSHFSRIHIYKNIADFKEFYYLNNVVPPNIAMDVLVGFLTQIMPINNAGWIFCNLLIITQIAGIYALNRSLYESQDLYFSPLISCIFTYNWVMSMGFLSYILALNIMLIVFSAWLKVRGKSWIISQPIGAVAGIILLFSHVIVFWIYALVVLTYEAHDAFQYLTHSKRQFVVGLLRGVMAFFLPLLLFILVFGFGENAEPVIWGSGLATRKVASIINTFSDGVSPLRINLVGTAILGFLAIGMGHFLIHRKMVLPVIVVSIVFLISPLAVAGGHHFDERLPLAILLLMIGSLRIEFSRKYVRWAFLSVLLVLLAIRSSYLVKYYLAFDAEVRQLSVAFAQLEPRSVLGVAIDQTSTNFAQTAQGRRFWHIGGLASVQAPVFVTTIHAISSQHTIVVQPPYKPLYLAQDTLPWKVSTDTDLERIILHYRDLVNLIPHRSSDRSLKPYLLLLHPATLAERTLQHGDLLFRSDNTLLVRLR